MDKVISRQKYFVIPEILKKKKKEGNLKFIL